MAKTRNIKEAFGMSQSSKTPTLSTTKKTARKSLKAGLSMDLKTKDFPQSDSEDELHTIEPSDKQFDNFEDFVTDFEQRLNTTLRALSRQVTADLKKVGQRLSSAELRINELENTCEEQACRITELEENNLTYQLKLEDIENRARRSNLRIRGIPESKQDPMEIATALFQDLAPNIPLDRLELDRAHRALAKPRSDGPPRDIIVKCHFYRSKEMLLQNARERASSSSLQYQGQAYQLFADIAPATIARRREMKPYLNILQAANVPYKWGFPFRILFSYKANQYTASNTSELKTIISKLDLQSSQTLKRVRIPGTPDATIKKKIQAIQQATAEASTSEDANVEMG